MKSPWPIDEGLVRWEQHRTGGFSICLRLPEGKWMN